MSDRGQFIKVVRSCENPWHETAPARAVDRASCSECVVRCAEHGERVAGFRGRTVHIDDQGDTLHTIDPFCGPHYRPEQHNADYGVPERTCCGTPAMAQVPHDELCDPAHRNADHGARIDAIERPDDYDGDGTENSEPGDRALSPGRTDLPTSGCFPAADFAGRVKKVLVSKAAGHVMVGYSVGIETGRFTRDLPGIRFIDPIKVGGSKFINGSWTSILDTAGEPVTMTNAITVWIADPSAVNGAPEAAAGDL